MMKRFWLPLMACAGLFTLFGGTAQASFTLLSEDFDDVSALSAAGWSFQNHSDTPSADRWAQGEPGTFSSQSGFSDSYAGVGFTSTEGVTGTETISNWMLTPEFTLVDGTTIDFFTRTVDVPSFADRLEIRLSTNGASTDVGIGANDVGDFTTVLATINTDLQLTDYPTDWTEYSLNLSGVTGLSGRVGFRYFVTDAGSFGTNSDFIGLDTLNIVSPVVVPEAGTAVLIALPLLGTLYLRRGTRRR